MRVKQTKSRLYGRFYVLNRTVDALWDREALS